MSNLIFTDQKSFMSYFGQRPGGDTAKLYRDLCEEEFAELRVAWEKFTRYNDAEGVSEIADACIDLIYVIAGLMHALGLDPQPLWDEVHKSNVAKIRHQCPMCNGTGCEPDDGGDDTECIDCHGSGVIYEVRRREDGKVLKPADWKPPSLLPLVREMLAMRAETEVQPRGEA